jgi:hypothetical protein
MDEVFDVAAVRAALEARLRALEAELHQARGWGRCWGGWGRGTPKTQPKPAIPP